MTKSLVSLLSGVLLFCAVFGRKFHGDVFTAQNFSIRHWTTSNGLPQNTINGIFQDSLGYIWMATNEGLVRFDGKQLRLLSFWKYRRSQRHAFSKFDKSHRWHALHY